MLYLKNNKTELQCLGRTHTGLLGCASGYYVFPRFIVLIFLLFLGALDDFNCHSQQSLLV